MSMTKARRGLLLNATKPNGTYAVPYYRPLQWALKMKYVKGVGSSNRYVITKLGRKALGSVPESENECPNCYNGTVELNEDNELVCRGECGAILDR